MQRTPSSDPPHSWLSNPLDWPHIDRMILLAALILLSPFLIGGGIVGLYLFDRASLNLPVALWLLCLEIVYALALSAFMLAALKKRQSQNRWELMESFIIFSYLTVILIGAWLSGTPFSSGLLLLVLGVNVASPVASIGRLKRAYLLSFPVFAVFLVMQVSGRFPHAPLFVGSPFHMDGSPKTYWTVFQASVCIITLLILYIGMAATERWGNREDFYREMSTLDSLTRLSNRSAFRERSELEFHRTMRTHGTQLSCIMLDIDHFKQVNDTYGHRAGDSVLVHVARLLMDSARQYDEVARYGGEEFVVLLPGTPMEQARRVAERLRSQIEASRIRAGEEILKVTASLGVATYPSAGIDHMNALLKAADTALYQAKHSGRNRVVTATAPA